MHGDDKPDAPNPASPWAQPREDVPPDPPKAEPPDHEADDRVLEAADSPLGYGDRPPSAELVAASEEMASDVAKLLHRHLLPMIEADPDAAYDMAAGTLASAAIMVGQVALLALRAKGRVATAKAVARPISDAFEEVKELVLEFLRANVDPTPGCNCANCESLRAANAIAKAMAKADEKGGGNAQPN